MKKPISHIFFAILSLFVVSTAAAQSSSKKAKKDSILVFRADKKELTKIRHEVSYDQAVAALKSKKFVLEATEVVFNDGTTSFVMANTNFVLMNGSKSTVQVAFNNGFSGSNGIGGVTVDGSASDITTSTDKKGNITYSFSVFGIRINAQITITLYGGDNNATVTILPDFNNRMLTLNGQLVPLSESDIFKGTPLF
ncbi:DUF4251 domain-containing protein [Rhizosphaericola mali]|uniref:DUF4251 domain-containing protein n=1 Tax=Rhizosphaericola mali TaxID=2545455 RepID=A0A5P2G439_9BACT|nr:DUF4251 domain-containing protein [Rhizosphaericola mali]QES89977.1 DUF4251 domain-containing protein [Rhizosphaericola mali]